jgi:hypothetical protein
LPGENQHQNAEHDERSAEEIFRNLRQESEKARVRTALGFVSREIVGWKARESERNREHAEHERHHRQRREGFEKLAVPEERFERQ